MNRSHFFFALKSLHRQVRSTWVQFGESEYKTTVGTGMGSGVASRNRGISCKAGVGFSV